MAKSIRLIYCRFVAKPSLFLEVFAGTGRCKQVKRAIMRTAGYPELAGKISLSGLPALPAIENTFDGVLCSAVLQHIPSSRLYESLRRIRELLRDEGIFIVSFPVQYPGIDSETNRDANGRVFHIRPEEKYRFLIERLGFSLIENSKQDDSLGRAGIEWGIQVWQSL